MYFDESAWVAIGFALFIMLIWKKAGAALVGMLDGRSDKISAELNEAKQLREDAARELIKFEGMKKEAEAEAKTIISNALTAADRIREDAESRAKDTIARREAQATAKIKAAEASLITELRGTAASLAVNAARDLMISSLDEKASLQLVEQSVSQIAATK
ncbi:MAG: ATP synthase F0 subunit B [Alphaproteobacteria bacterium]|jgi:F-type H+-transporting ATPase subunit b|nr:ATP synthase F0 subunit B [Alphaproteobacteria bacterium]